MSNINKIIDQYKDAKESEKILKHSGLDALKQAGSLSAIANLMKGIPGIQRLEMPKLEPLPKFELKPIEEVNEYSSAKILLQSLHSYYTRWSAELGEDTAVGIYGLLPNGAVIKVQNLTQEGFNGIAVEGTLNDAPCLLMTHQASLQFLCVAETVTDDAAKQKIGFIY